MKHALVVDDDRTQRRLVAAILADNLHISVLEAANGRECLEILARPGNSSIEMITLDIDMPVMDGITALPQIIKAYPDIPVIMVTGTTDSEDAAQAIKMGATDFFSKPVNADRIVASARNALRIRMLNREVTRLTRQAERFTRFSDIIGAEGALAPVIAVARKAATQAMPILITGETGTGKEVLARAIHGESGRAGKAFVAVNCGAIPENLVESTLFGHEKGAFTGAVRKAPGKFREADGGTIFLDEIGDLPLAAQVKLLRVLQEQEVEPVGADRSVSVDVRVISATHSQLEETVRQGRFREDLYFRLNVLPLSLPPLRQRLADIPALTDYFAARFAAANNHPTAKIAAGAMQALQEHLWPGNVRELENTINRSLILCDEDVLNASDIAFLSRAFLSRPGTTPAITGSVAASGISPFKETGTLYTLEEWNALYFDFVLAQCGQNVTETARQLGIAKSTLYRKLNSRP